MDSERIEIVVSGSSARTLSREVHTSLRGRAMPTVIRKDHMEVLSPFLPAKYSPLQASGQGLQSVYLTAVPDSLADALVQMIGAEAVEGRQVGRSFVSDVTDPRVPAQAQAEWEEDLARRVEQDTQITVTEKRQVILARRGQGKFRERVSMIERACRITRVNRPEHLRASHCKPWRDCESNDERLDGENGLLLTPTVDHLFDRGFISFENNGELLIPPVVHRESLKRMGIPPDERRNVGAFSEGQRRYLEYHRDSVFLEARVRRDQRCNSSDVNALRILKSQTATSSWGVPRARNVSSALSIRRSGLPWRPADFWRFTAIFNSAVAAGRR